MNEEHYYGGIGPGLALDSVEQHLEELSTTGFTVLEGVLAESELAGWRTRIDAVYERQEAEFGGREALSHIGEQDLCRAPLLYDHSFMEMATKPRILEMVRRSLGEWSILSLQNAIINRPEERHHQSAWHRDLPYQNWTSSQPLALGALFAIDPFTNDTGGTVVLPYSHRRATIPSETYVRKHAVSVNVAAGSALMFDAMLFHRAGLNRSERVRRGVNHLYTVSLLKQQYDFPRALGDDAPVGPDVRRLLGFDSQVPLNALEWRRERARRSAEVKLGAMERQ